MLHSLFIALFLCLVTNTSANTSISPSFDAIVIEVQDGDTITIAKIDDTKIKVRLVKIDAPELKQSYGPQSQRILSKLILNKRVRVDIVYNDDRYNRLIANISTPKYPDISLVMVRLGAAWVYRQFSRDPNFLDVEDSAKARRKGLWSESRPVPPWDYRRQIKASQIKSKLDSGSEYD